MEPLFLFMCGEVSYPSLVIVPYTVSYPIFTDLSVLGVRMRVGTNIYSMKNSWVF